MARKLPVVAFLPAHPAQLWVLRPVAQALAGRIKVVWLLRDKDICCELADGLSLQYDLLSIAGTGLLGNGAEYLRNLYRCVRMTPKIDLWVTKYGPGNMAATLFRKKSVSFNDDDVDAVPLIAWTSYPFSRFVLTPRTVRMGRFSHKALRYSSYHELFYLHPNRFRPDPAIFSELGLTGGSPFAIVRLSALQSHHDQGIRGISESLMRGILQKTQGKVRVFITSEKPLAAEFEPYRFPISPTRIHHALAQAQFFIGDSQTMAAEAAVLGVPALRLNDFVGKISYLDELEKYGLAYGFRPDQEQLLLDKLYKILTREDRSEIYQRRREGMLADKIDPAPWFAHIVAMFLDGRTDADIRQWAVRHAQPSV